MKIDDLIGPTGDFPEGKLNPTDEGGLTIAVSTEADKVRIDFGTPTVWFAMNPDQALEFANVITMRAGEIKIDAALRGDGMLRIDVNRKPD